MHNIHTHAWKNMFVTYMHEI